MAVLNRDKHGCDVLGSRVRLSLLRTAYEPDSCSDEGHFKIQYALLPHSGDWRRANVPAAAAAFNAPLIVTKGRGGDELLPLLRLIVAGDGVMLSGLRAVSRGRAVIMRVIETFGRSTTATLKGLPPGSRVWQATVLEDRGEAVPVTEGAIRFTIRPWQVMTLLVDLPKA